MQFAFRNAPEWFYDHIIKYYTDDLYRIQKTLGVDPKLHNNREFKQITVDYFTEKGFTVWLDEDDTLWFDIDQDSTKWTYEILRG